MLCSITLQAEDHSRLYQNLPVEVAQPAVANIPALTVSLTDFGAVGDGVTDCTEAFAKAISHLNKQGGGHLNVPAGIYLTGPVKMKSLIDLHVERGAIILFSPDKQRYVNNNGDQKAGSRATPPLTASKCHDISITGEGIIDGNGEWWRAVKHSKVSDTEWKVFLSMGGTQADNGQLWYPHKLKHLADIAETPEAQERMRPHLIRMTDCERVLIKGVTVQNAPKFHIVPQRCKDVIIDGVTVRCPWNAQNGDGIDLMQCQRVLVTACTLDVGDDGICLKGGVGAEGVKYGPCADILITGNTVFHAHGGFVIGSEFSGGMHRIVVSDCTFSGTDTGLRFKSGPGRGGKTSDIHISDIRMSDIKDQAIVFETSYADRPAGSKATDKATSQEPEEFIPEFCDIHISRVTCRDTRIGIAAKGTLDMIHDIRIDDSIIFYTSKEKDIDHPDMVKTNNVKLLSY
jgi:polygalacturonase